MFTGSLYHSRVFDNYIASTPRMPLQGKTFDFSVSGLSTALVNCDQHMWMWWHSQLCQYKGHVATQVLLGTVYWPYRYSVRGSAVTLPSLQSPLQEYCQLAEVLLSITPIFQMFNSHWQNKKACWLLLFSRQSNPFVQPWGIYPLPS